MVKHVVCDLAEIPQGSCKSFMIEGTRIALYNVDGDLHATQNHCTHKGAQLIKGSLEGSIIECSQHGWKFDVKTGDCLAPSHGRKLKLYPVSIEQNTVTVELEDKGSSAGLKKPQQPKAKIEFHAVADTTDLGDEDVIEVIVGEQEIALYRLGDDYYATHGQCTHENVSLCDGFIEDGYIECPLHGACFNIRSGKVISSPAEVDLKTYPVKLEGNRIYVGIESD
jgi:nitrite reductase/ring-hydroxylating ferredoxin subunit